MGHSPETSYLIDLLQGSIALPSVGVVNTGAPTLQLTPTDKDYSGRTIKPNFVPTRLWVSSDPTKATVNQSGLVTKVAAGTTNITCAVTLPKYLGGATVTSNACVITVS